MILFRDVKTDALRAFAATRRSPLAVVCLEWYIVDPDAKDLLIRLRVYTSQRLTSKVLVKRRHAMKGLSPKEVHTSLAAMILVRHRFAPGSDVDDAYVGSLAACLRKAKRRAP